MRTRELQTGRVVERETRLIDECECKSCGKVVPEWNYCRMCGKVLGLKKDEGWEVLEAIYRFEMEIAA